MDILIGEGNYIDESLKDKNMALAEPVTENLMLAVGMYLDSFVEYLLKGFDLELYYPAELPEFFYQSFCAFDMLHINR